MKAKVFFLILFLLITCQSISQKSRQYVILVSLDGFRADYPELHGTPNLLKIAQQGIRVKRMIPSNPTKTFPNHYTMATGLYPTNHNIIHNKFYDPDLDRLYKISDRKAVEDPVFYGGEPIWVSAEKQGVKAASFFWVGSEAPIQGIYPSIWKKYDEKFSFDDRIDSVCSWLQRPHKNRPHLITLYYHEPDRSGHHFGPNSKEVQKQVRFVDQKIGKLHRKLQSLSIADSINLIIVSDHGMRTITTDKKIILSDYLSKDQIVNIYGSNPVYTVKAKDKFKREVKKALKSIPHLRVFPSDRVPQRFHFGLNKRTGDFFVVGKKGWSVIKKDQVKKRRIGGTHGYLHTDKQMHAICIAKGPAFKKGYSKRKIQNVDLYPLLCEILQIEPAKTDGNLKRVKDLLVP